MSTAGEELELSTTGERLAQIALVLGLIAAIELAAGAVVAFDMRVGDDKLAVIQLGSSAAGVAFECFLAAVLLRWARSSILPIVRPFIVVLSALAAALIALAVVVEGSAAFDSRHGFGFQTLAGFILASMAVVFAAELFTWWMTSIDTDDDEFDDDDERDPHA